ncbi:MAG TPA: heavy metal translocating P-type ATPase [Mariprofundaceae bacterium]|nr:heavy metal translocating P-type ATPase [Mariprofundaceae bacterium]
MSGHSPNVCFHCGLPVAGQAACEAEIGGIKRSFCCSGCMTVCQMIHESGLESFYTRLNYQDAEAPPPESPVDLEQYDLEEVQGEFVRKLDGGRRQAHLLVDGIHCAACVWLIEKGLSAMEGVELAEVNLAHHRLNIRWDSNTVSLSSIMMRLAGLGYAAAPFNPEAAEGSLQRRNRSLLFRMAFAAFGMMNIMWISIALYAGAFSGIDSEQKQFFHWVSFFIASPVLLYSGWPFFRAAFKGLQQARLTMDLPIVIGSLATWVYSCWVTINRSGEVYFDTVVTFLFVILVGRYLEGLSKRNASSAALKLMELQPRLATRLIEGSEDEAGEERVATRKLVVGDRLLVRPGEKVPADGVVIAGRSNVDESMLSGEAKPVLKLNDDSVVAGSINLDGSLTIEVRLIGADTALAHIVALVEEAQGTKAPVQRLADRIVPWFVAATLGLALITFLYWLRSDFDTALLAAVSVLIITCPCALGLATPMGIAVGVGAGAQRGVLVRNGEALETLSAVTHVVFDKTGTLTEGKMRVVDVMPSPGFEKEQIIRITAALESQSRHPLATAIVEAARLFPALACESFVSENGLGVKGLVEGHAIVIGNVRLMQREEVDGLDEFSTQTKEIEQRGGTAVFVSIDGQLAAVIDIQDRLRDEAAALIKSIQHMGISMTMLTGDAHQAARELQQQLGDMDVVAELLPEEKEAEVRRLQERGERVLMIGDGVNDAPALARADVSMAMGSGMDVSMACADIVLVSSDLSRVGFAMSLAEKTLSTIRQNIVLSLLYNLILVPAAMAALVTPVFAAIAMPISSLLVIGNAILIRKRVRLV